MLSRLNKDTDQSPFTSETVQFSSNQICSNMDFDVSGQQAMEEAL